MGDLTAKQRSLMRDFDSPDNASELSSFIEFLKIGAQLLEVM